MQEQINSKRFLVNELLEECFVGLESIIKWDISLNDDSDPKNIVFEVTITNSTNRRKSVQILSVDSDNIISIQRGEDSEYVVEKSFLMWCFFDLFTTNPEATVTGVDLIANERWEQIHKHGRTVEDDLGVNKYDQLSTAASILAMGDVLRGTLGPEDLMDKLPGWSVEQFRKMYNKPYYQRLIIAGALIAAELDRLKASE